MRKFWLTIMVVLVLLAKPFAQASGLIFNSHEVAFEKRTGIDLSPENPFCFHKNFELDFDISLLAGYGSYYGYITRIIGNNKNIDLLFNQTLKIFEIVIDEKFTNIRFAIDSPALYRNWNTFALRFDLEKNILQLLVNGQLSGSAGIPGNLGCFKFYFGANDSRQFDTKDLPPMQIRNIRLSEQHQPKYYWPLDETAGDTIADKLNKQHAVIKNPVWKKPRHQQWELADSFSLNGYCGAAFNPKEDELYIAGSDTLATYLLRNRKNVFEWIPTPHLNLRIGNQAIFDTISNKLYDFYIDQKKVVTFDFTKKTWKGNFEDGKITEFWHANKFISSSDSCLYIIGGYGEFKYKNLVQRYNFATQKWEQITPSGDYFFPRFLAGLGADAGGELVYIIGGFGSRTGDQMLGAGNIYDLLQFNARKQSFKKLYDLKTPISKFAFANSLVIDPKSREYYGLVYPNDSTNSSLQVITGNFTDSVFTLPGNTIPFRFHDIESFSDFYYSEISGKLIAVILNYSMRENGKPATAVKIYTINFPPVQDILPVEKSISTGSGLRIVYLLTGLAVITGLILIGRKKILKRTGSGAMSGIAAGAGHESLFNGVSNQDHVIEKMEPKYSAILLFGQFQVFDHEGNDITGIFSPLQKELFLLVIIHTIRMKRGISSAELDGILWHDKSEKDAKNNRAVNITRLRAILEKIGNCSIVKESAFWQFKIPDDSVWLDYKQYSELLERTTPRNKENIATLIDILKKGSFLYQTEYDWLDNIKSEISNSVIGFFLDVLKHEDMSRDSEFIIEIANCIFNFDQLNEDALAYKCKSLIMLRRHTLANNVYQKFRKDYMDIYGIEFSKSFQQIIS